MLREPADRYLTETSNCLIVEAGSSDGAKTAGIFRAFAARCLQKQINRVLVKTADGEAESERGLRDAFTTILLAGIPPNFRIALVVPTPLIQARYRNAQRDLSLAGVNVKLFDSEADAAGWLGIAERATRAAAD